MLITINILSAMSIVMALLIPYFILLHLNNKLRKEVEGALNRILEVKQYSEITRENLETFAKISNQNNKGQDENWKNCDNNIDLITEALKLCQKQFINLDEKINDIEEKTRDAFRSHSELHDKTIKFMQLISKEIYSKDSLKEEDIEENNIKTITIIENLADFNYDQHTFKKGFVFELRGAVLFISNEKMEHKHQFILMDTWAKNLWKKILEVNQPKPKRKYTKRAIKNEN
jgi:hypothetical protein